METKVDSNTNEAATPGGSSPESAVPPSESTTSGPEIALSILTGVTDPCFRVDANWIAGLVVRGIVDMDDAEEMIHDLAYRLAKRAYKFD